MDLDEVPRGNRGWQGGAIRLWAMSGRFRSLRGSIQLEQEHQHKGGFLERAEEQESGWAIFIGLSSQFPEKGKKVEAAELQNVQYLRAGLGEGRLPRDHFDRAVLVTVLGETPGQVTALKELHSALKAGGILSVTEVIFDPHFQCRETVLRAAQAAGFREKNFFGRRLAFTLHLEKVVDA